MKRKLLTQMVRMTVCLVAWFQRIGLAQGRMCNDSMTGTVITLREALTARQVSEATRWLAMSNFSNVKSLPYLRMITACRPANLVENGIRGIEYRERMEDDAAVETASWALDRLDQRELPLDNRAYDPSNCTRHHGGTVETFVIDTGCDVGHSVFQGRRIRSIEVPESGNASVADDNGHGTEIASLLIGKGTGVARNMKVTCIKALDKNGKGGVADVAGAIELVVRQTKAEASETRRRKGTFVVMSLTGVGNSGKTMDTAVKRAEKQGVVSFAAAGNQGRNACEYSPGREAIGVGAMRRDDLVADFSNWGVCVDAIGPGKGVVVADGSRSGGDGVRIVSGTSYSAPLIAGLVGLQWEGGGVEEAMRIIEKGIMVNGYRMPTLECEKEETLGGLWAIIVVSGVALCVVLIISATVN